MSKLPAPKRFWDIVKSLNVGSIQAVAQKPLRIAIVGDANLRNTTLHALSIADYEDRVTLPPKLPEWITVLQYDSMDRKTGFPQTPGQFDFVIDVSNGRRNNVGDAPIYSINDLGGLTETINRILDDRPTQMTLIARHFPAFRTEAAKRVIAETSGVNAQFALLTGLAEQVPILGQIGLPTAAISDMIMLTKNQVMMTMHLATIYGLDLDLNARSKDLLPIQGNAFGWRAVARELVGTIPILGFLPRAAIAYAGTQTCGKAMQFYYETGEHVTPKHLNKLYREALSTARVKVRMLATILKSRKVKAVKHAVIEAQSPMVEEPKLLESVREEEHEEIRN